MYVLLWIALGLLGIAAAVCVRNYLRRLRDYEDELRAREAMAEKWRARAEQQRAPTRTHVALIAGPTGSGKSTIQTGIRRPTVTISELRAIPPTRREGPGDIVLGFEHTEDGEILNKLRFWDTAGESRATVMNALMKMADQSADGERAVGIWVLNLADIQANHRFFTEDMVDALWGNDLARKLVDRFVVLLNMEDLALSRMTSTSVEQLVAEEQKFVRNLVANTLGGGYSVTFVRCSALTGQGMREAHGAVVNALGLGHLYDEPAPITPIAVAS